MPKSPDPLEAAKRIMSQLIRQPPKPHSEMKVGKKKPAKAVAKRKAKA